MSDAHSADVVIVGSGMNSLTCAALLAQRGLSVTVLERNAVAGGCIRTQELFPGFTHDVLSSWYPLFMGGASYATLAEPLAKAGLEFVKGEYSTGLAIPGGPSLALRQDMDDTVRRFNDLMPGEGDALGAMAARMFGPDAGLVFGLLGGEPYRWPMAKLAFGAWRERGLDGLMSFGSQALESFRRWAMRELRSDLARAMLAPWVLHSGLGPDEASSALIGKLTFSAVVSGGMPVVKGGSYQIVKAFTRIIEEAGGAVLTNSHVDRVLVEGNKATGVCVGTQRYLARRAVVCNVTPGQLYGDLLPEVEPELLKSAQDYHYGRGGMQIHFALNSPPDWLDPELRHVPMVHVTESMEQVCSSVVTASNGYLPAKPTLAVGQPVAVDVTRAPEGHWILWVQMQELPRHIKGDEAGEIPVPADGRWNEAVREAMADRVQARLETVMPGLAAKIIGRRSVSPADLEALNMNLVGGDPYSGVCSPDQFFFMRPFAGHKNARSGTTPWRNLHQIGASVHPGPGLGGQSGYLAAQRILKG
ncbi:phytoene desaturase family protein [Alcaligenes phenolicus]